ncbi:MAG: hypothetical protein PWQ57_1588 [Desulfovibrionales bacterium]|nr:hypothetical protein [Desulfovibrionales bacterium]
MTSNNTSSHNADDAPGLLAVDVGLVTGFALFSLSGRLLWARSRHLGRRSSLKRLAVGMLRDLGGLRLVVLEGGGDLAEVWEKEAVRRGIEAWIVSAEEWRAEALLPRERGGAAKAKQAARRKAREAVAAMDAAKPVSLSTDAAEAVLIGLYAVKRLGWRDRQP